MSILEARSVWKFFGSTVALSNVSLSLGKGFHVIAGPNGSGKTTLIKLWSGLIKPSRGSVLTLGLDPYANRSLIMTRVNVAFEDTTLPWWTNALDYLRFVAERRRAKWGDVRELASLLGVDSYWSRSIRGYSSGMRKKVILLQALIGEPEILLLDEPYTLLDRGSIVKLNTVLQGMVREGKTIVVATHIFTDLEYNADSLTVLFNGTLLYHGGREDLIKESIYVCDKGIVGKLEYVLEHVEELIIKDERVIIKVKPGVNIKELGIQCTIVIDIRRVYEKTLEIIR